MSAGTRRRGDALEAAIFEAVIAQLKAVGHRGLTMEGVAAAAQTGKAALYRRWASKDELIRDALLHVLPSPADVPEHGDVRADLLALLTCYREMIRATHGTLFHVIKMAEGADTGAPLHLVVRERVAEPLKELLHQALRRGAERGEVRPEAATRRVALVGPSMLTYESMIENPEVPDAYLVELVDDILMPLIRP